MSAIMQSKIDKAMALYLGLSKKRWDADNSEFNNRLMSRLYELIVHLNRAMEKYSLQIIVQDAKGNQSRIVPDQILSFYDYRHVVYGKKENEKTVFLSFNLHNVIRFELNPKVAGEEKIDIVDEVVTKIISQNHRELFLAIVKKEEEKYNFATDTKISHVEVAGARPLRARAGARPLPIFTPPIFDSVESEDYETEQEEAYVIPPPSPIEEVTIEQGDNIAIGWDWNEEVQNLESLFEVANVGPHKQRENTLEKEQKVEKVSEFSIKTLVKVIVGNMNRKEKIKQCKPQKGKKNALLWRLEI